MSINHAILFNGIFRETEYYSMIMNIFTIERPCYLKNLIFFILVGFTLNTFSETSEVSDESSPWDIRIGLGYGKRQNPLINEDDLQVFINLDIAWYGKSWFFDNGDVGYSFLNNETSTANITARVNSERNFFQKNNTSFISLNRINTNVFLSDNVNPLTESVNINVPDRNYALELGLEWLGEYTWGNLYASGFFDISDSHNGQAFSVSYSYGWQMNRWYFEPQLTANWQSQKLNTYYWGADENELSPGIPEVIIDDDINYRFRFVLSYQVTPDWQWATALEYERLSDEISSSPIVERNSIHGFFTGYVYRF